MIIISHRGYWLHSAEKNGFTAFQRSFELGFGTETDVRDCAGQLLISHDMPKGNEMLLEEFLSLLPADTKDGLPLAINIKSDGLAAQLSNIMQKFDIHNWFAFDMSVPDMRSYFVAGLPVYTRMSEVEQIPTWLDQADGIWLDAFQDTWFTVEDILNILDLGKRICIVSPELHQREHLPLWEMLLPFCMDSRVMLCTDKPEEATAFFKNGI
jgi:hypothetical protein